MPGLLNDKAQAHTTAEADVIDRWPSVSVVVATRNRAVTLADTLAALSAQDYPNDRFEIVVVNNSSSDDTEEIVQRYRQASRFPVRYFRKANEGPAAARNFGVARSTGALIGFTDSDCTMGPDWVRNAVSRFGNGVGLVSGPVRPVINPARVPGFCYHQTDHRAPNTLYPTANVFYRRAVLEELGGFDESFGTYPWGTPVGGDDIDLGWRVRRAGYRAVWATDAPVDHEASSMGVVAWLIEPVRLGILPSMVRRIPDLRTNLPGRYFAAPEHPAFYLAVAGAVGAALGRRWWLLGLALPWLWLLRPMIDRDVARPVRWWRVPVKYLLTAVRSGVGAAALIHASIRERTVVI